MKNTYCKLAEKEIHALPERFKGFLLSPFQFNQRGGMVGVPEDTFTEMIEIIAEYAQRATPAATAAPERSEGTSDDLNHREAYELACFKRENSNLARCYLDLSSNARSAASGDLPPLPEPDVSDGIVDHFTGGQMEAYGRACLASNAGAVPGAYRLLDTRDTIEPTDEWLSNNAVTWAVNPSPLFYGCPYVSFMLPARRRAAPSNNSPVGAQGQDK